MSQADPIIEEIRATREAIAKHFDYNIKNIVQSFQENEAKNRRNVVHLPARKVSFSIDSQTLQ